MQWSMTWIPCEVESLSFIDNPSPPGVLKMICQIFGPNKLILLEWMVVQRVSPALTKNSLTFTFNGQEPWQKFETFLIKHIRIGHVINCRDPDKN